MRASKRTPNGYQPKQSSQVRAGTIWDLPGSREALQLNYLDRVCKIAAHASTDVQLGDYVTGRVSGEFESDSKGHFHPMVRQGYVIGSVACSPVITVQGELGRYLLERSSLTKVIDVPPRHDLEFLT